jgi:hypothetical protein
MPNLSVLVTRVTISFVTCILVASLERSTDRATSLALKNGFLIRGTVLVIRETHLAPKMSVTFGAGDSDG